MGYMKIKHAMRDSSIFFVSICGVAWLYRALMRKRGPLVRIIAFHDVADSVWFETIIATLHREFHIITPAQFHAQEFVSERINILLTFDDGYKTWIDTVAPILEKYKLKGLFFINSGLLNCASDQPLVDTFMENQLRITPKKALSWNGMGILIAGGHTIGGHSITHPNLTELDEIQLEREVGGDKRNIESHGSNKLHDFAYPFGTSSYYNTNVRKSVKKVGYSHIYTAVPGFLRLDFPRHEIPRMLLERGQSPQSVTWWIQGAYDIFSFLHTLRGSSNNT